MNDVIFSHNIVKRVLKNASYSTWQEIKLSTPQESVLGPFLFNLFINDHFYEIKYSQASNFADDNTIYVYGKSLNSITSNIERGMKAAISWYRNNKK